MLIEPTPALPPSRSGRARLLAAIVLPAMLLVGVVGVGALTRDVEAGPVASTRAPVAVASLPPAPSVEPEPTVGAMTFPARILGLPTRTVADLLARRRAGDLGDELQVVIGYLTVRPGTTDCFIGDSTGATLPMIQSVGCRRGVLLAETDEPLLAWSKGEVVWRDVADGAHLHVPVFAGVSLADLEVLVTERAPLNNDGAPADAARVTPILPRAVVVIGRFGDPRVADPRTNAAHVNETFTLERVVRAGADRQDQAVIQLVAPPRGALAIEDLRAHVSAQLPSGTIVLSHAFIPLDQLASLDAAASGAARDALGAAGVTLDEVKGVWYVRVMVRDENPVDTRAGEAVPRRLGWVNLTADGALLGAAIDGISYDAPSR